MTKLDTKHPLSDLPTASISDPVPAPRLIVLVPGFEINPAALTHRVWELANAMNSDVLFLGLYDEASQESRLRRELITLSAMVRDDKVSANVEIVSGKNWVTAVKMHFHTGDTVVCFAEQRTGPSQKPLSQVLQSELNLPLYILSGLYTRKDSHINWIAQIAIWGGSICILAGFFLLQVRINDVAKDSMKTLLWVLSVPAEVWAIWAWNSLFG